VSSLVGEDRGPCGNESGALMHIFPPRAGSLSPHSINSFWQDRTESKKSFDRTSLDLICPICLICGLQADLYPQVESGGGSRTIPHSVEVCCTMLELKLHKSRLKIATGELS
jgi:hypothetical protein